MMKPYHVYIVSLKQTISCSPFPRKPAVKNAKQVIVRAWLRAWGASGDTSRRATKGMWYYARHPGSHARTLTCFALIVPSMFSRIRETTRSQPLSCIRLPGFHISKPSRNHSKWIKWKTLWRPGCIVLLGSNLASYWKSFNSKCH